MKHYLLHIIVFIAVLLAALTSVVVPSFRHSLPLYENSVFSVSNVGVNSYSNKEDLPISLASVMTDAPTDSVCSHTQSFSTSLPLLSTDLLSIISPSQLPPLDAGMVNVTGSVNGGESVCGYRTQFFKGEAVVVLPYAPELLPHGYTEEDIQTYVYSQQYQRWIALPRDSVNTQEQLVCSRFRPLAKGFSPMPTPQQMLPQTQGMLSVISHGNSGGDSPLDFINAVIQTPEMPETSAYTPTSIKELQAAHPLEGLTLMQPPTANNRGTIIDTPIIANNIDSFVIRCWGIWGDKWGYVFSYSQKSKILRIYGTRYLNDDTISIQLNDDICSIIQSINKFFIFKTCNIVIEKKYKKEIESTLYRSLSVYLFKDDKLKFESKYIYREDDVRYYTLHPDFLHLWDILKQYIDIFDKKCCKTNYQK